MGQSSIYKASISNEEIMLTVFWEMNFDLF